MSLLQNIRLTNAEPIRRLGDTSDRQPSDMERLLNRFVGFASLDPKSGIPDGYVHPYAWFMPIKEGGMSCYMGIVGEGGISSTSYLTKGATIATTTLTGSGTISEALLSLIIQLSVDIEGSGTISDATMRSIANMGADITGDGDITTAELGVIAWCLASLTGSGDLEGTLKGFASMSADIKSYGDLTPEGLRDAVWGAIATNYNVSGTMGQKLNSAAVGGVDYDALAEAVWDAEISGRAGVEAGKVLEDIKSKTNLIPGLF